MDLKEIILNDFGIYPVREIKEVGKGISSDAKLIITSDRKYILRKVRDKKQAITEYKISKALSELNISSKILLSKCNRPFIEYDGKIYNIQTYICDDPVKNKIDFYNLGKVIALFHSETQRIEGLFEQDDRFSLSDMWERLKYNSEFSQMDFNRQLTIMVEQCLSYHHESNCYIHGDLGIWNLFFYKTNIYIIDFGEARRGNNHFDISAVISSTIDLNLPEKEIIASLVDFRKGYVEKFDQFDWFLLIENLTLWFTRGIIALLVNNGINNHTCEIVKQTMENQDKLDDVVKRLSIRY